MTQSNPNSQSEQSLIQHLEELRSCLVKSLWAVLIAFLAVWSFSEKVFDVIRAPIQPYLEKGLVFTGVMDKFMAHIKVSLLAAIILSCPFWLFQLWRFISPALYKEEKKYSIAFMFFGTVLFLSGVSFVYFVVYPQAFNFLMNFAGNTDAPMITIEKYLHFFFLTTMVFGLMFELPLILTILGMLGIIDQDLLKKNRRFAIVFLACLSAVVTPPDVISMVFMLIPLLLLFEISIFLVGKFQPK